MNTYYITDIDWDTSDPDYDEDIDFLPDEVVLPHHLWPKNADTGINLSAFDDEISDFLSREYGLCVNSFNIEKVDE